MAGFAIPWREPLLGDVVDPMLLAAPGLERLRAWLVSGLPEAPLSHFTGMRLRDVQDGVATVSLPLTNWLAGADGMVGPGSLTIAADAAMAFAIMSRLPAWTPITTTELAMRMLSPLAPRGRIDARSTLVSLGPELALADVVVFDQDRTPVAHGSSLCMVLAQIAPPADAGRADSGPADGGPADGVRLDGAPAAPDRATEPWQLPAPAPPAPDPRAGLEILRERVAGTGDEPPLHRYAGIEVVAVAEGETTLTLPASRWFRAPPPGRVQGGMVALLADEALTAAVGSVTGAGSAYRAIERKINYLRPLADDGRAATATARVIQAGRRIVVATAEIRDASGRTVAIASRLLIADQHGERVRRPGARARRPR